MLVNKVATYINLQHTLFLWVASFLYQRPWTLRVLYNILAGPSTSLEGDLSEFVPGICCIHFSSMGVAAWIAPVTTGTTDVFSSCILSQTLRYFSSLSCSVILMLRLPSCLLHPPLQCLAVSQWQDLCRVILHHLWRGVTTEFPVQTWYRCSCTLYQVLDCGIPCMLYLLASNTLLWCVGLSQGLICTASTLELAWW